MPAQAVIKFQPVNQADRRAEIDMFGSQVAMTVADPALLGTVKNQILPVIQEMPNRDENRFDNIRRQSEIAIPRGLLVAIQQRLDAQDRISLGRGNYFGLPVKIAQDVRQVQNMRYEA